ncbi:MULTISPECIES: prenyltransferase [unclassified Streptococcus]|uniref:prenyltransferase n=1 Tax=unclassified Streptococcus TaxID=2608887 RepID=UPI0010721642|nr:MULTISPECIES: prenyltransferase [unclassified Streptococcus]MBF0786350.1 prenyltransferase [Streptococcus sp. 19428wC2_LYSM12]MCQ9212459.1 prenyltransferase [Streptococcus sp. B01]MCQ9213797.1 prenyltransferase [Streptococcus sp. O1]TFV06760.1 prenyltransferase [Streptococcus sp. LYSM12]
MSLPIFLELVEVKAKTASILPFLIGMCFSYYAYGEVRPLYVGLYFIAMLLFNMFVDVWDNYNDYRHAVDLDYQEKTNIIGRENLSLPVVERLMLVLFTLSLFIGLLLSWFLGWPLLVMGGFCYAIGIFYSSGPKPLSNLPLGEICSGFTMGFMITLICVYLNTAPHFIWNFQTLVQIFLIALPNTLWIANLMLANNLCDKEEDERNHRYTLVHYIGIKGGLYLFATANGVALLAIVCQTWLGIAPPTCLLSLLLLPFIVKQTKLLYQKQVKSETFPCAIKILALGSTMHVLTYALGIILP